MRQKASRTDSRRSKMTRKSSIRCLNSTLKDLPAAFAGMTRHLETPSPKFRIGSSFSEIKIIRRSRCDDGKLENIYESRRDTNDCRACGERRAHAPIHRGTLPHLPQYHRRWRSHYPAPHPERNSDRRKRNSIGNTRVRL